MDDWTDAVAVGLANGQPFEVLRGGVTRFSAGTTPAQVKAGAPHESRRDNLGTTHHEAGTMRMGAVPKWKDPADSVEQNSFYNGEFAVQLTPKLSRRISVGHILFLIIVWTTRQHQKTIRP